MGKKTIIRTLEFSDSIYIVLFILSITLSIGERYSCLKKLWWIGPIISIAMLGVWLYQKIKSRKTTSKQSDDISKLKIEAMRKDKQLGVIADYSFFCNTQESFSHDLLEAAVGVGSITLFGEEETLGFYYDKIDVLLEKPLEIFPQLSTSKAYCDYILYKQNFPPELKRSKGNHSLNQILYAINDEISSLCKDAIAIQGTFRP